MVQPTFVTFVPLDTTPLDRDPPRCYCVGPPCAKCRRQRRTRLALLAICFIFIVITLVLCLYALRLGIRDATAAFKDDNLPRGGTDAVACAFMLLLFFMALYSFGWICVMIMKELRPRSEVARRIAQMGLFRGPFQELLEELPRRRDGLPRYTP